MRTLNNILKEELARLKSLEKHYESVLAEYPRGCLIKKRLKGHAYYYLNYREKEKQIYKYLGRLDEHRLSELQGKLKERNKLRKLYIQVKQDIKSVGKKAHG